jgi:hypothetical protein
MTGFALSTAQAQFSLGIKGGLNLANLSTTTSQSLAANISQSLDNRTTYVFGVYTRLGNNVYIQPEVLLAASSGRINVFGGGSSQAVDVSYTNIDVPVLLGVKILGFVRLNAGVVGTLNVNGGETLSEALRKQGNLGSAVKAASYGYVAGAGLDLGSLGIDLRYMQSLSDVASASFSTTGGNFGLNQKAQAFQLTASLKIF